MHILHFTNLDDGGSRDCNIGQGSPSKHLKVKAALSAKDFK